MIKIKHKHKAEWDYLGWKPDDLNPYNPYNQEDWNQTLLTKMNFISVLIFKGSLRGGANRLRCNKKVFKIIETLAYFNKKNMKINNKYKVKIDKLIFDDAIYLYSDKVEYDNLIPSFTRGEEHINDHGETEAELYDVCFKKSTNKGELKEFKKSLVGKIEILNYEG